MLNHPVEGEEQNLISEAQLLVLGDQIAHLDIATTPALALHKKRFHRFSSQAHRGVFS